VAFAFIYKWCLVTYLFNLHNGKLINWTAAKWLRVLETRT